MVHFLICENPKCRFILDRRLNGRSRGEPQLIVKKCPDCGAGWSATCPTCHQPLAVKFVGGAPHTVCCARKPHVKAQAA
jgi:hypothetical protein